jgi:hypothetical protein
MHVPGFDKARDENVRALEEVLTDVAPVKVLRDPLRTGILTTYRRGVYGAWSDLHSHIPQFDTKGHAVPAWSIIMQDDAVPADPSWKEELEAALLNSPHPFVSLCHFSDHGLRLALRGKAYGEHVNAIWGQAVAYRSDVIDRYWDLVDTTFKLDPNLYRKWDDGLAAVYNLMYGTKSCITSRAVFTHLNVRSTQNHVPGKHRHPACTIADPRFKNLAWDMASVGKISIGVDPRVTELAERMTDYVAGPRI